ncbi:30S ribosome-binding factor RbfA [Calycomorphotria hydatis]|uniref:Ribosome-binding factor A n=1 Tax=Calycomorphotria hydatis TaxID=2528027 RepID=A0A517TCT6_9PLAN|nr:30S ribosome-binding factor RbfA [Calycomorphotria hydatis]QDT66184.1 Ribosome-binding factor A [Calycomorphotria hydatis]
MNSRRLAKISQAIREVVSTTILFELRDPRIQNVTVTAVETAEDLRSAKVKISVMGDEKAESLCLKGLNSSRGFLQSKIAKQIDTRYTPILSFEIDHGIKKSLEASRILREALGESTSDEAHDFDDDLDSDVENETASLKLHDPTDETD